MINIGQVIKEELDRQGHSVGWLAKQLGRSRSVVYRFVANNSLDTEVLANISRILHRDFFKDLSDDVARHMENSEMR